MRKLTCLLLLTVSLTGCQMLSSGSGNTTTNSVSTTPANKIITSTNTTNVNSTATKSETTIPFSSGPLLGKWQEKDSTQTHTMEFKTDGTLAIVFGARKIQDTYAYTAKDQIKDTDAKGYARYPNFKVNGSEMTLIWSDAVVESSKNQYFVRVKE